VLARAYGASVLALLLSSLLLLAIAGWFLGRWPVKRWATTVAVLILAGVVALAVFGQRLVNETNEKPAAEGASAQPSGAWEPWSPERLAAYQSQGRPVFVDFSASWCLTCQVNERAVLNQPGVQRAFADHKVALLRADWTRHDEAITKALTAMGRSGVPAYALYVPGENNPRLLPEVLTPGIVTDAVAKLPKMAR
jgi:thiol:disulfide interchange protein DsbD